MFSVEKYQDLPWVDLQLASRLVYILMLSTMTHHDNVYS